MAKQHQDDRQRAGAKGGKRRHAQQSSAKSTSPRSPDEMSKADQDAGSIASPSGQKEGGRSDTRESHK
jgi:hypothetical protein